MTASFCARFLAWYIRSDYIGLDNLMSVPQAMDDVPSCLREGQLHFDSLLGDILLLPRYLKSRSSTHSAAQQRNSIQPV